MNLSSPKRPDVETPWYMPVLVVLVLFLGWRPHRDRSSAPPAPVATLTTRSAAAANASTRSAFVVLAAQDWLLLLYLLILFAEVLLGSGPRRPAAIRCVGVDLTIYAGTLWIVRGDLVKQRFVRGLLYRAAMLVAVLGSFLQLQYILPTVSGRPVDAELHALDLRLFGVEPSVAWDHLVRPATTEWYAFFYYGYFLLIAAHALPLLFFGRSTRVLNAFSFGFLCVYCVGHVLYTFVPAYGPYAHLAASFDHPLAGSFWWPLVKRTVESVDGGARTDVFPSLHTAVPTFIALFSFQHRRYLPFRFTWAPLALFATQIVIATMFLRWHYLIDVCAGLTLAVVASRITTLVARWDAWRVAHGGADVFPSLRADARAGNDEPS